MNPLEARQVGISLKGRRILAGVDLAVGQGEVLGLLGPNGAGKTTLLKVLAGLLPFLGRVTLDGRDLSTFPAGERARRISFLPQEAAAHWPMPVQDVVALGRLPYRGRFGGSDPRDEAAIERAMTEADILPLARRPFNTLSGGERTRVLLARALAVEAPVLLADEPVAFLDPGHQLAVLELLRRRAAGGDAVIVVLHDLTLATRHCHRVTVLDEGAVAAEGPPALVLDDGLLERVYGIRAARGRHRDHPYLLPWDVARS